MEGDALPEFRRLKSIYPKTALKYRFIADETLSLTHREQIAVPELQHRHLLMIPAIS